MRNWFRPVVVLAWVVVILGAACSDIGTNPNLTPEPESLIHVPWEDEEAELLAVHMSGEIGASRALSEQVISGLQTIRETWGDTIPHLNRMSHRTFWYPGHITLSVEEGTYNDMNAGIYPDWDSLNSVMMAKPVCFHDHLLITLGSSARLNSVLMAESHRSLPGVRLVEPTIVTGVHGPRIYGKLHESGPAYLLRDAWGDCFVGCISSHYWYFRSIGGEIQFVGEWDPRGGAPEPEWWNEAKSNKGTYELNSSES